MKSEKGIARELNKRGGETSYKNFHHRNSKQAALNIVNGTVSIEHVKDVVSSRTFRRVMSYVRSMQPT